MSHAQGVGLVVLLASGIVDEWLVLLVLVSSVLPVLLGGCGCGTWVWVVARGVVAHCWGSEGSRVGGVSWCLLGCLSRRCGGVGGVGGCGVWLLNSGREHQVTGTGWFWLPM